MCISLMNHQQEGKAFLLANPFAALFYEPGLGKTATTYAGINESTLGKPTLVLAPKSILHAAWADDAAKFFPYLRTMVIEGSTPTKRTAMIRQNHPKVFIANYECFKRHAADFIAAGVGRLVVDESSKLRNYDSAISKMAYEFARKMESCWLLTGTPAPNNNTEYFGQIRCIAPDLFGSNFYRFAYRYFTPIKRMFNGREVIEGWKQNPKYADEFNAKIASVSLTRRAVDCLDLPAEMDEVRHVDLGPEESTAYAHLMVELEHELDDGTVTSVAANAKTMKLRQVTGGSLYHDHLARIIGNSKLNAMNDLLEEIGPERQVVIWATFTSEIDRIAAELKCPKIDGSVAGDERTRIIRDFQAGKIRYIVCQPAAAAHGITLTAARFNIFYSIDFFPENHEQARRRIYRTGQRWPVVHYYLIARNTVDERTLKVLRGKADASAAMKEILSGKKWALTA